jgi:GDPmannose 4,6-dehydratase
LNKKEKVIVTTRSIRKKILNYNYLKIQKRVRFERLDFKNKSSIQKIIDKYKPDKIFYFAGQSSLTKSLRSQKETFESHFIGTKNFLDILKEKNSKIKFFKANSGYIFSPNKGQINLNCKFSTNKNPYIEAQKETFKLLKKYRKFGLNLSNLIFMQVESPLRPDDFFIKKVCLGAKNKDKIKVGNINTYRDYSWITEVAKAIFLTSKLSSKDYIISSGKKISGKEILAAAYKLNKLNFKNYYSINKKFCRTKENKILIGSTKNISYLKKNFNFKFKIFGNTLIGKMYKSL